MSHSERRDSFKHPYAEHNVSQCDMFLLNIQNIQCMKGVKRKASQSMHFFHNTLAIFLKNSVTFCCGGGGGGVYLLYMNFIVIFTTL